MARRASCCAIAVLIACASTWSQGQTTARADAAGETAQAAELERCPPPEGACAEDVVGHVLANPIGSWERLTVPRVGHPSGLQALPPTARNLFSTYVPVCGSEARYRNTAGPGTATVCMLAFRTPLDALGFFAAQRTGSAKRVLLTSAAYRDHGVLHIYSASYFLRIEAVGGEDQALPPDQYLGARLEVRLPQQTELPRIIRIMPRGWVNALTVSYEPTDLLGPSFHPMAAGAQRMVASAHVQVRVMEAADATQARAWYTGLLQQALQRGRAWEAPRLGDEGFFAGNGNPSVGMRQDRFLVWVTTDGDRADAEAIMRVVGTTIRITRPLPGDADDEACHTPASRDTPSAP